MTRISVASKTVKVIRKKLFKKSFERVLLVFRVMHLPDESLVNVFFSEISHIFAANGDA